MSQIKLISFKVIILLAWKLLYTSTAAPQGNTKREFDAKKPVNVADIHVKL